MKNKTTFSVIMIVLLLSASTAFAWHGDGYGHKGYGRCNNEMPADRFEGRMEHRLERMSVILDLSAEQQKTIEGLTEKHWAERQKMRDNMLTIRDQMRDLRFSQDADADQFRTIARQQADLKADMMAQRIQHKKDIMDVLTPEQRDKAGKLWDMRDERRDRRGFGPDNCARDCGNGYGNGCGRGYHRN